MGLESYLLPHLPHSASQVEAWSGPDAGGGEKANAAGSVDRFRHLAVFYRDRGEYLLALRAFIQPSRERPEAVLVAVPQRNAEMVRQQLGDGSADITLLDMTELGRNPARIIPAFLTFAVKHPGQHVCFTSEPVWPGRTAAEMEETARHEALINAAFRDSTVLCLYDSAGLPRLALADAASTHPYLIEDGQQTASSSYLDPRDLPLTDNQALPAPPAHAETLDYSGDLRMVRSFVATRASGAGLSPRRISDLVLAISELAANTLRHTTAGGTVQLWQNGEEIICQVADTGQITDPLAGRRPPSHGLLGGNGLWLVNQLCDLAQARTGPAGTTTRLHMRLHQP